jgi:NAD+ synthase
LYAGTGNWEEGYIAGYFTKRGDGAADNNIFGGVPKHLVREALLYMAAKLGTEVIVDKIVSRPPSAGLEVGQTDEGDLGFDWPAVNAAWTAKETMKENGEAARVYAEEMGVSLDTARRILFEVSHRHESTEHKRVLPKVGVVDLLFDLELGGSDGE